MPRAKVRGSLERSALADLFKHTLSQIPTTFGRLLYLASLRDANSGTYRHHGLSSRFGRKDSVEALAESHRQVFQEWIRLPLAAKHEDLGAYLGALDEPASAVIRHWRSSRLYVTLLPDSATPAEKEFYSKDLEILLQLLNLSFGAEPDPASLPLQ